MIVLKVDFMNYTESAEQDILKAKSIYNEL